MPYNNFVLINYLGDESAATDFPHGNRKHDSWKYVRTCPSVLSDLKARATVLQPPKCTICPSQSSRLLHTFQFYSHVIPSRYKMSEPKYCKSKESLMTPCTLTSCARQVTISSIAVLRHYISTWWFSCFRTVPSPHSIQGSTSNTCSILNPWAQISPLPWRISCTMHKASSLFAKM